MEKIIRKCNYIQILIFLHEIHEYMYVHTFTIKHSLYERNAQITESKIVIYCKCSILGMFPDIAYCSAMVSPTDLPVKLPSFKPCNYIAAS